MSKYAREAAEFVNLYSKSRGVNRFPALVEQLDWLRRRPEVKARGVDVPNPEGLRRLGRPRDRSWAIRRSKQAVAETGDADLKQALAWSHGGQRSDRRHGPRRAAVSLRARVPGAARRPGRHARRARQTPNEALEAEWEEHDLAKYVRRDLRPGSRQKKEIARRRPSKYPPNHTLMIGDAPGDYKAAVANNCLFFPINPGRRRSQLAAAARRRHRPLLRRHVSPATISSSCSTSSTRYLPERPPWPVED